MRFRPLWSGYVIDAEPNVQKMLSTLSSIDLVISEVCDYKKHIYI